MYVEKLRGGVKTSPAVILSETEENFRNDTVVVSYLSLLPAEGSVQIETDKMSYAIINRPYTIRKDSIKSFIKGSCASTIHSIDTELRRLLGIGVESVEEYEKALENELDRQKLEIQQAKAEAEHYKQLYNDLLDRVIRR